MVYQESGFSFGVYAHKNDLSPEDQSLIEQASLAGKQAYAPYSNYNVGVAIRTSDQKITIGSNQENSAFPIGQCAERVALYNMVHLHGRIPIDTIAISVDNINQKTPASPCGSCRQMLSEYRNHQQNPIRLLLTATQGETVYEILDVKDLLPLAFDGTFLGL